MIKKRGCRGKTTFFGARGILIEESNVPRVDLLFSHFNREVSMLSTFYEN